MRRRNPTLNQAVRVCAGLALMLGALLFGVTTSAHAATRTWDGDAGGFNNFWSTPGNWVGNQLPVAGDRLIFPAGALATNTFNDFPSGTAFESISFTAAYTVVGNRILLGEKIEVLTASTVSFQAELTLDGPPAGTATITLHVADPDGVLLLAVVGGPASAILQKTGPGLYTAAGVSTYLGPTALDGGAIRLLSPEGLGSSDAGTTVAAGTVLQLDTNLAPILEPLTIAGAGTASLNDGAITLIETSRLGGPITLTGPTSPRVFVPATKTLNLTGVVTGATGLVLTGPGATRFAGTATNTYTGQTLIGEGTLRLERASPAVAIPAGLVIGSNPAGPMLAEVQVLAVTTIASGVTIHKNARFDVQEDHTATIGPLTMTGGTLQTNETSLATLAGNVTIALQPGTGATILGRLSLGASTRTFAVGGAADGPGLTLNAIVSGTGGLTKTGTGPLLLERTNEYTGLTTVAEGRVVVFTSAALGATAAGTTVTAGSTIVMEASVGNEPLVAQGNGHATPVVVCQNGCEWGGSIVLDGSNTFEVPGGSDALFLNGAISGSGSLVGVGPGRIALGGANTYAGSTTVQGLRLEGSDRIPNSSHVTVLTALDLNGYSETIAGITAGPGATVYLGDDTLTLTGSGASLIAGTLKGSGAATALVKQGTGILELREAQPYTGLTSLQNGILLLNAQLTGPVSVTGGILRGGGRAASIVATGGRVEPGQSSGTLTTTGAFTLNAGATLEIEIEADGSGGFGSDQVKAGGAVTLGGATLDLQASPDLVMPTLGARVIVSNETSGPTVGTFANLPEGATVSDNGRTFRITYTGGDGNDVVLLPDTVREYYLSEGATGDFFDLDLLLANPNTTDAPVTITFLRPDGTTVTDTRVIPARTRRTVRVDEVAGVENTTVSMVVKSDSGVPLVVERTMTWDQIGYGAHTEKAVSSMSSNWYFAEGAQGFFSTYLLLANPRASENTATVTYFRENAPAIVRTYPIAANARFTVDVGADPELVNQSFGMHVAFSQPGVAERSMYFGADPLWKAGHQSAGVSSPSATWFLAEGATGPFFETFILLANPAATAAQATVTFLPSEGAPVVKTVNVPAQARVTLNIEAEDASLANAAVATQVQATAPILVERAQYWPDPAPQWYEAHNSFGVTEAGLRWGLAEGHVGGPRAHQTYILLANPGATDAHVTITFLREDGSPFDKSFVVSPQKRFNVETGPGTMVPELEDERFGALIVSDEPIVVERAMYSDANGQVWAAGTNATATALPQP